MARIGWKEYDYTVQAGPGFSWVHRPLLHVEIHAVGSKEKMPILAMIDSGTDGTVLHSDIAEVLGIDRNSCRASEMGGIGTARGFIANVRIVVPDFKLALDAPVFFADDLPLEGLLGQKHFFPHFKIRFEKDKNKFYMAVS